MAKKPEKKYSVHAELHRLSDIYGDQIIETHDLERLGVSEKQVVSRLRYSYDWYDHDNEDSSVSYEWRFTLTVITPEEKPAEQRYEQLRLFDIVD